MYRERATPVSQGSPAGLIAVILILIAGGAVAGWWFFLRTPSPGEVVQRFAVAAKDGDVEQIKPYLSQSTLDLPGFERGMAAAKERAASHKEPGKEEDTRVKILNTVYEGADKNTAVVTFEPEDKSKAPAGMAKPQEVILVKEEGKWKIDLAATLQREFQKAFGKGFKMPKGGPGLRP